MSAFFKTYGCFSRKNQKWGLTPSNSRGLTPFFRTHLTIAQTPRPAFARFFPADVAVAVELGDDAGRHAGDQRMAIGQTRGTEGAGIVTVQ